MPHSVSNKYTNLQSSIENYMTLSRDNKCLSETNLLLGVSEFVTVGFETAGTML